MPEAHDPAVDDVVEVLRLVWVVNHALRTRSHRADGPLALNDAQRLMLWMIGQFPEISPGRIAQVLRVHPSTTTRMLRDLERLGTLNRTIDPEDARRFSLQLTATGRALSASPHDQVEALAHDVLARLPKHKVRTAREVLAALSLAVVGRAPAKRKGSTSIQRPAQLVDGDSARDRAAADALAVG